MPGFYAAKLKALLDTPTIFPEPKVPGQTRPPAYTRYYPLSLDMETKAWLYTKAKPRYLSRWIDKQVAANQLPRCWVDTRPDELRQADRLRLEMGLMPLWTEGSTTDPRHTNLAIKPTTAVVLALVAETYGIVPQQYATYATFEGIRGPRLGTELTQRQKISATLRAWAGGYITPRYFAREEVK